MGKSIGGLVTYTLNCREVNCCIKTIWFSILRKIASSKVLRNMSMELDNTKEIPKWKKFTANKY